MDFIMDFMILFINNDEFWQILHDFRGFELILMDSIRYVIDFSGFHVIFTWFELILVDFM